MLIDRGFYLYLNLRGCSWYRHICILATQTSVCLSVWPGLNPAGEPSSVCVSDVIRALLYLDGAIHWVQSLL